MNIFKKIFLIIDAVILFGKCYIIGYAGAEEAPHDIKLTCETKYIDINEIPEDRMVKLAVSIDNNPGFQVLCITIDIDSRLSYNSDNICKKESSNNDISCINYSYYPSADHQMQFDIFSDNETVIVRNGELMIISLKLPDLIQSGDFFKIGILDKFKIPSEENDYFSTYICTEMQGKPYRSESFSELNCGGIYITGNEPVQEQTSSPTPQHETNNTEGDINNENKSGDNVNTNAADNKGSNEVTTENSSVTAPVVSSTRANAITTPKKTSAVTTVTKETTKNITSVSTEAIETIKDIKSEDDNNIIWVAIAAVTIIVIGGSVIIFIKKGKKDR